MVIIIFKTFAKLRCKKNVNNYFLKFKFSRELSISLKKSTVLYTVR